MLARHVSVTTVLLSHSSRAKGPDAVGPSTDPKRVRPTTVLKLIAQMVQQARDSDIAWFRVGVASCSSCTNLHIINNIISIMISILEGKLANS